MELAILHLHQSIFLFFLSFFLPFFFFLVKHGIGPTAYHCLNIARRRGEKTTAADTSRTTNIDQYSPMVIIEKKKRKKQKKKNNKILVHSLSRGTYRHTHTTYIVGCLAQLSISPSHIELSFFFRIMYWIFD